MSLQLSTGLRNAILDGVAARSVATYTAATIAAVDGGGSADTFTDSANGFLTAGIFAGDSILVLGWTGANAGSYGPFKVTSVVAGTITVPTGSIIAADAAGESITVVCISAGAFRDVFKRGIIRIYTGAQPTTADLAATGTKLLEITLASGAFVGGAVANGLEFGAASSGSIAKSSTQTWSGVAVATGTAGWFRLYGNAADEAVTPAISTTLPRLDGAIATSGAQLNMSSTAITLGATTTIDTFTVTLPAS